MATRILESNPNEWLALRCVAVAAVLLLACCPIVAAQGGAGAAKAVPASLAPTPSDLFARDAAQRDALEEVDEALDEIQQVIANAYFFTALGVIETRRKWLDELGLVRGLDSRRARLEVLATTAEVALGQRARARESMRRALRADALLQLDERVTSPRIYSLWVDAKRDIISGSRP